MAVLKTAPARFLVYRIWDQWSWRQRFCADLTARVRMMWGPLVQSFRGCINPVKHTKYAMRSLPWGMTKLDQGCFGPSGYFWLYCSYELSGWDMGDFICFERHLEACGISIRFDLQKVPRRAYTDDLGCRLASFWLWGSELIWWNWPGIAWFTDTLTVRLWTCGWRNLIDFCLVRRLVQTKTRIRA